MSDRRPASCAIVIYLNLFLYSGSAALGCAYGRTTGFLAAAASSLLLLVLFVWSMPEKSE